MSLVPSLIAGYCLLACFSEARWVFRNLPGLREDFDESCPGSSSAFFVGLTLLWVAAAPVTVPYFVAGRLAESVLRALGY